ncbi:MAG: pyridoxal 5'-phosphate synthase glutaminase subunit PdxT [Methanobacteriota archaeon]
MLSIQGAVSEHIQMFTRALQKTQRKGTVSAIKEPKDIDMVDALVLPGGESTTITRVLMQTGSYTRIRKRIEHDDLAILGTCAGCILLAKELTQTDEEVTTLQAMDMQVERNAFGRQKESFEHPISFQGFSTPFPAVFIRAPIIKKVWGDCTPVAYLQKNIIAAKQGHYLALSFHPELTSDLRVHTYFLEMI